VLLEVERSGVFMLLALLEPVMAAKQHLCVTCHKMSVTPVENRGERALVCDGRIQQFEP
jgi:hypothetical protein